MFDQIKNRHLPDVPYNKYHTKNFKFYIVQ